MREQPRACAVLGLGPFARTIIERLPPGVLGGPAIPLALRPAPSRAGHDWLPHSLRGPAAPALAGTRAGGRLDVLAGGKATLRTLEPTLASFATRCRDAGGASALVLLVGLFDVAAGGLLDLIAILRASEALDGLSIVVLGVLSPSPDQEEPFASARAALALEELDSALSGGAWELPQPGGVLSSPQVGAPQDATLLLWPAGPRWTSDEAEEATIDALMGLPWVPELPGGGLGALRVLPILAPAAELRDRLAERYAALTVERWLAPGAATLSLEDAEARVFANPPSDASDWLEGVRARTRELLTAAEQVSAADPEAAADHVRFAVPAMDRQVTSEIGAGGSMRRAAEDAARRWVAGARVQAEVLTDELCGAGDGGGFALIELAQQAPERLVELRSERERQVGAAAPGAARDALDAATESLREAIDKPAGLSVRLLGRGGARLMQPLRAWAMAFEAWAEAHWCQAAARVEVGALGTLAGELLPAANQLQEYEVHLREAVGALRSSGRGANERPTRGVVVLPTGAAGLDEAAERLEHLGGPATQGWLRCSDLGEDPSSVLLALRDRLRTRLGPAEARLTLGGALASLPPEGSARAALDHAVTQAGAPLLGAAAHEELVAVLPPDAAPEDLRLPEGAQVVCAPRREDGLLIRLAGGFDAAALGLRKAALDEGLSRLVGREPKHPDVLWRRFSTG